MGLTGKRVWQVAAGDTNRDYADVCLEWDVILNGPGEEGPWPTCREALRGDWGLTRKISDLKRFAEEIAEGDVVVLRLGTTDVLGVGVAAGEYLWSQEFGDVDGWDLAHVRRVKWVWKANGTPQRFDTYTMKLGDTVQLADSKPLFGWISTLDIAASEFARPIADLPQGSREIDWKEISEYLFDHGVASNSIERLGTEIHELVRISRWYQRTKSPSEHETVAYLAVPLLRALGWTPQKMAIEWANVDIALFRQLPRENGNLEVVVEAKKKDRACLTARSQAKAYAEQPGRERCNRLVVTDGLRYGVYLRHDGGFRETPDAYLNLTRMRDSYPILGCAGARDALLLLSTDWARV